MVFVMWHASRGAMCPNCKEEWIVMKSVHWGAGAVALFITLPVAAQEKAKLEWKFTKGATFYQDLATTTNQNMKVMGQDVSQKQTQTFYFSWTPQDQDKDGNWTLVQKIIGVKMQITINDQTISFDSQNPSATNSALPEVFKALLESEFKLTIDKTMKVTKGDDRDD